MLVGISTSGNSPNVIAAVEAARKRGVQVVGLLGRDGGKLRERVDLALTIGVAETAHIQECHIMVGHMWCAHVDAHLAEAVASTDSSAGVLPRRRRNDRRAPPAAGARVVMTNGCFDILHPGHIEYLEQARALGDRLIVAVNDDDSVRRLKGDSRPVNALAHRLRMLVALGCVDWVVPFTEDTPERLICAVLPDRVGRRLNDQIAVANSVRRG